MSDPGVLGSARDDNTNASLRDLRNALSDLYSAESGSIDGSAAWDRAVDALGDIQVALRVARNERDEWRLAAGAEAQLANEYHAELVALRLVADRQQQEAASLRDALERTTKALKRAYPYVKDHLDEPPGPVRDIAEYDLTFIGPTLREASDYLARVPEGAHTGAVSVLGGGTVEPSVAPQTGAESEA